MCIDHQIWMVYDGLLILLIVLLHFTHILWWLRDISELSMQVGMEHTWRFGICLEATQQHTATYSNRSKFSLPPVPMTGWALDSTLTTELSEMMVTLYAWGIPTNSGWSFQWFRKILRNWAKVVVLEVIMISQLTARVFSMLLGWFQSIAAACSQV